jgi:hypothetical protein
MGAPLDLPSPASLALRAGADVLAVMLVITLAYAVVPARAALTDPATAMREG